MRTTSSWWLLNTAEYLRRMALPVKTLFDGAGLSFESLMYSNTRYPQDGVTKLWELIEQQTKNEEVGFVIGRNINIAGFPVLGYSLISAVDLKDGFERFFRYQRAIGESANINLAFKGEEAHLTFNFFGDVNPICKHTIDMGITVTVSMIRVLAGEKWHPKAVHFVRKKPRDARDFDAFFQCPILFEQNLNSIIMQQSDFSPSQNKERHFDTALLAAESANSKQAISDLVGMFLHQHIQDHTLDRSKVAVALNMSPRSLQRKLAAEGTSYQKLIDRVREDKSKEYLSVADFSLTEVAFLCGFSDPTAFNRAFKRWFGISPGEYRLQLNNEQAGMNKDKTGKSTSPAPQ